MYKVILIEKSKTKGKIYYPTTTTTKSEKKKTFKIKTIDIYISLNISDTTENDLGKPSLFKSCLLLSKPCWIDHFVRSH